MSCVTIGGQEVSAQVNPATLKEAVNREPFSKSKQLPRDHNRRLLQQNLPAADIVWPQHILKWPRDHHGARGHH
jgi:hypothetical protein